MPEQPPSFVVVDKRKFTAEGEMREPVAPDRGEQPPATQAPDPEPAKVLTMPQRLHDQGTAGADDLAEEEMAGTLETTGADNSLDLAPDAEDEGLFDEADGVAAEPHSAEETAALNDAYRSTNERLNSALQQANPGMQATGEVTFEHVVQSFYLSAIMAMGAGTQPGQQARIDILGARQSIDMLSVLEEKTKGNLTPDEAQLLQGITFELRMTFLEITNAISRQAMQAPPPGGGLR